MSTDTADTSKSSDNLTPKPIPSAPTMPPTASQSGVPKLIIVMQSVKTDTPEAKLNETTISDGKGGRITMDDQTKTQTFKGVEPRGGQVFRGVEQDKPNK